MSTRSTIWYRAETAEESGIHLYHVLLDDEVHLEVTRGPFCLVVALPQEFLDACPKGERK